MTQDAAFKREVRALAKRAKISYTDARARILRAKHMHEEGVPHFICPKCHVASTHADDIKQGYCFQCQEWTGDKKE